MPLEKPKRFAVTATLSTFLILASIPRVSAVGERRVPHIRHSRSSPGFHPGTAPELRGSPTRPKVRDPATRNFLPERHSHAFKGPLSNAAGSADIQYEGQLFNTSVRLGDYLAPLRNARFHCHAAIPGSTRKQDDAVAANASAFIDAAGAVSRFNFTMSVVMKRAELETELGRDVWELLSVDPHNNRTIIIFDEPFLLAHADFDEGTRCGNLVPHTRPYFRALTRTELSPTSFELMLLPADFHHAFSSLSGTAELSPDTELLSQSRADTEDSESRGFFGSRGARGGGGGGSRGGANSSRHLYSYQRDIGSYGLNWDFAKNTFETPEIRESTSILHCHLFARSLF
jgi:hypothetical protein